VGLSRVTDGTAAAVYEALGQFETSATAPSSGTCTGTKVGACCYGTTTGTAPTPASAGDITITDGAKTLVTLMSPGYAATSATDATLTWAAGATLKITAAGATVDGFTTDIVAPAPFAALTPAFGTTLDVSTSKDLVVTWTPGKGACNQISFGLTQGTGMPNIDCIVDDSAGTLTVPKSLLGMLTAASGTVVIERVIGKKLLAPNAGMSVAAIEVVETQTTYTP